MWHPRTTEHVAYGRASETAMRYGINEWRGDTGSFRDSPPEPGVGICGSSPTVLATSQSTSSNG